MKNWKLTVCDALITRLMTLALLEDFPLFQDIYLDALKNTMADRSQLRHTERARISARAVVSPAPDCCTRSV